jgi:hypothetical protein
VERGDEKLEVGDKNPSSIRIAHGVPIATTLPLFRDNQGPEMMWSETIKKEARGLKALDLGEVQAVGPYRVKTERGLLKKETFYIPRDLAEAFDGSTLFFRIAPGEEVEFWRGLPASSEGAR